MPPSVFASPLPIGSLILASYLRMRLDRASFAVATYLDG